LCAPVNVQFTQNSSGTPKGYLWSVSNGFYSNAANPTFNFTEPGTYTIRLITVYEKNTAEKTRTITINRSVSSFFDIDRDQVCLPSRITFTADTDPAITNYSWNFGDGTPVVNGPNTQIDHIYADFGDYNAVLTCSNAYGCEASYQKTIKVRKPVVNGLFTLPDGCIPATNSFSASVSLPPGSAVISFNWTFGDGQTATTTNGQISHNYLNTGVYAASVNIITNDGCISSFQFDTARYGLPPTSLNSYPVIPVFCGSEKGQFVSTANNADNYAWDFGGGLVNTSDISIQHKFSSLGVKTIYVTPSMNNCPGTTDSMQIEVIGVIAKFTYSNTCNDKKTFSFVNNSAGNLSEILWRFNDQTPTDTARNPIHTFPQRGAFRTKLLVEDYITGCIDSAFARIFTANPVFINPDTSICINTNSRFRVINSYPNTTATYLWNVLSQNVGPITDNDISVTALQIGSYSNNVIISNGPEYCPDSLELDHWITVRGPQLDFTAPSNLCLNLPLVVTNLSRAYQPADSIRTWCWNFGQSTQNDSVFQPRPFLYSTHRSYDIKLIAIDKFGCKDSLIKQVSVRPLPFLWVIPKIDTLCLGQRDSVIAYTSDQVLWTANVNGPGFCATCDSTLFAPLQTTKYTATSTNAFNCSVKDSTLMKVYQPFNALPAFTQGTMCEGEKIQLGVAPADKITSWSPSETLSNPSVSNPIANPKQTTRYRVELADSVGCYRSSSEINVVVNPKPTVNAGADKVFPYYTEFSLAPSYSSNVRRYEWSPADSLSCSTCPVPTTIATRLKTYTVKVTSDSGCVATDQIIVAIECKDAYLLMPTAFTPNNDGKNDFYYPLTRGIGAVKRFSVYNRSGQLVFDQQNFSPNKNTKGWSGRYNNTDQPAGTYVYILEAICEQGQSISKKGNFLLIR